MMDLFGVARKLNTCLLLLLVYYQVVAAAIYYNAYTDSGTIVGRIESLLYKGRAYQYVKYLGIPYAADPIDWLSFKRLSLREAFTRPYNATHFRPPCLQTGDESTDHLSSEDCLFLNIYAPIDSTINPKRKFAVIVYIHGGKFLVGSSNDISPELLSVAGDVIIVTINYRLGIFGFLNSGNEFARGNYGLWDQQLAIRWIRYNIGSFRGDVDNISLMGHEAGAASVMFQTLYPGNRGLFHRVIALSGTFLSPWALHGTNLRDVARELDCYKDDDIFLFSDQPIVECIRHRNTTEILKVQPRVRHLGPTVDGDFIIDHPVKILNSVNNIAYRDSLDFFRSLDIVTGITENDGSDALLQLFSSEFGISNFRDIELRSDEFEQIIIPDILRPVFDNHELLINTTLHMITQNSIRYSVMYEYTNWTDPENPKYQRENLLRLTTDANFMVPAVSIADAHSYTNYVASTYVYKFTHTSSFNMHESVWKDGAGHGSELLAIFGFPKTMMVKEGLERVTIPEREYNISENMMRWISNFAKTKNPNEPNQLVTYRNIPLRWPEYHDDRQYIRLSSNITNTSLGTRFGEPGTSFWTTLVPVLLENARLHTGYNMSRGDIYFTAFHIVPDTVDSVLITLIAVICGQFIVIVLLLVCACRCVI